MPGTIHEMLQKRKLPTKKYSIRRSGSATC